MSNLLKNKKVLIWIGIVLAVFILIVLAGANYYIANTLQNKIESGVNRNSKIPYSLNVGSISVGIFSGSLKLKDITITPKQFATDSLAKGKLKTLYNGHIDLVKIKNAHIIKFLREKKLSVNKFVVKGVSITGTKNKNAKTPKTVTNDSTKVKKSVFSEKFAELTVGDFNLEDASYSEVDYRRPNDTLLSVESLSVFLKDIVVNRKTYQKAVPLSFKKFIVEIGRFSEKSMKFYNISTTGLDVNVEDTVIVINEFGFLPKYSRREYNKRLKYENDLFSIKTKKIELNGLGLHNLLNIEDGLKLNSILIYRPDIEIYRDKTLPDPPDKYHPLLAGMIRKIPLKIVVDSLMIIDAKLVYAEKQKLSDIPGEVMFDPMNILIKNITNDPQLLNKDKIMTIDVKAKLMAQGDLVAHLDVDLTSENESFKMWGNLGHIKAKAFNSMSKGLLLAEITSGDIKKAIFSFNADDDVSNGTLYLDYENLKVRFEKQKDKAKKAKMKSLLVNEVIRSNNMPGGKKYREGVINFERDKAKGVPNFLWKSTLSGIISIVAPIGENKKQRAKSKSIKKNNRSGKKENKKADRKKKKKKKNRKGG